MGVLIAEAQSLAKAQERVQLVCYTTESDDDGFVPGLVALRLQRLLFRQNISFDGTSSFCFLKELKCLTLISTDFSF